MLLLTSLAMASSADARRHGAHGTGARHRSHRVRAAKVHPIAFIRMPSERGAGRSREVAMAGRPGEPRRLNVSRGWGRRGVGSLGYERLGGSPIDVHEVNAAAGTQFGAPDAVVGGGVSYRF